MSVRALQIETEAARGLLANISTVIGDDEDARHDAVEGETSLIEVLRSAARRVGELEAHEAALKTYAAEISGRASRMGNQASLLRAAIEVSMASVELRRIETDVATLTIKPTPPKVVVTDEQSIPLSFWKRSDPKLDLRAIGAALKEGAPVAGAELSNGSDTLQMRSNDSATHIPRQAARIDPAHGCERLRRA